MLWYNQAYWGKIIVVAAMNMVHPRIVVLQVDEDKGEAQ
jgi:hypothetical protein